MTDFVSKPKTIGELFDEPCLGCTLHPNGNRKDSLMTDFDPEDLLPDKKMLWVEQDIRHMYRVLHEDYLFWGKLADELNETSHTYDLRPDAIRSRDIRHFNRMQDLCNGYIQMRKKTGIPLRERPYADDLSGCPSNICSR